MGYINWIRRRLISALAGRMEVRLNMTVVDGHVDYSGQHGRAVVRGNRFIQRTAAAQANAA